MSRMIKARLEKKVVEVNRDDEGVAILDPKEWKLVVSGGHRSTLTCFNVKTLQALSFGSAVTPIFSDDPWGRYPKPDRPKPPTKPQPAPTIPVKSYVPAFTQNLSAADIPEKFDMFKNPVGLGGYQFPCLSEATCNALFDEALKIHSECGLPLNHMGLHIKYSLPQLWKWVKLLVGKMSPSVTAVHPDSWLKLQSAFFVRYEDGESHQAHADNTDLTINLCLGKSFTGGELRLSPDHPMCIDIPHQIGYVIAHHGKQQHDAKPTQGDRMNLIIWCKVVTPLPFWPKVPADIQTSVLSYVDGNTLAAYLCCSKASQKTIPDTLWANLLKKEFPHLQKDAETFRATTNPPKPFKKLYMFARKDAVARLVSEVLKGSMGPPMMMKETYEMGIRRQQEEAARQKANSFQIIDEAPPDALRNLQQRLSPVSQTSEGFPWFFPAYNLPPIEPVSRGLPIRYQDQPFELADFEQDIQAFPPQPYAPHRPHSRKPAPEPAPIVSFFAGIDSPSPVAPPNPYHTQPSSSLDTDGTDLAQFSWFWPQGGCSLPTLETTDYIRWFVCPWNGTLALTVVDKGYVQPSAPTSKFTCLTFFRLNLLIKSFILLSTNINGGFFGFAYRVRSTSWVSAELKKGNCAMTGNRHNIFSAPTLRQVIHNFQVKNPTARQLRYPFALPDTKT